MTWFWSASTTTSWTTRRLRGTCRGEVPRARAIPHPGRRRQRVGVQRRNGRQRGAQRGRRAPQGEYGIEPTSFTQLRPGTYDHNERVKDMSANGVLGSLASRRSRSSAVSSSPAPRTRTSPWRWCRPTTTGTSTSGAAVTRAFHPVCDPGHLGSRSDGRRDPAGRPEGLPRTDIQRESVEARLAVDPFGALGPGLAGLQ
jgi:hypothetical protein